MLKIPNIFILGSMSQERLSIFSFLIKHEQSGLFLHSNFVASLLNDMFGIQKRSGCACAGPYVQQWVFDLRKFALSVGIISFCVEQFARDGLWACQGLRGCFGARQSACGHNASQPGFQQGRNSEARLCPLEFGLFYWRFQTWIYTQCHQVCVRARLEVSAALLIQFGDRRVATSSPPDLQEPQMARKHHLQKQWVLFCQKGVST